MASVDRIEYMREYRRRWTAEKSKDPEFRAKRSQQARKYQKSQPEKHAWHQYNRLSREREQPFELSRERFNELLAGDCAYCGAEPSPINGIDRVDVSEGYVEGNVVPCCSTCNYAKRLMPVGQFIRWARRVAAHSFKEM